MNPLDEQREYQYKNILYNLKYGDLTMSYRLDIIVDQVVGCMATVCKTGKTKK